MAPVFSLVMDRDVSEDLALLYPELYKELTKVSLSDVRYPRQSVLMIRRIPGTVALLQDVLHVASDQHISRSVTSQTRPIGIKLIWKCHLQAESS